MNRVGDTLIHFGANEAIVQAFDSVGVDFLLIGGLAVAWYCNDRQADDMDLLVDSTHENSERIYRARSGLQLKGFTAESFVEPGLQVRIKERYYAELLTLRKDGLTYSEVTGDAVAAKLFGVPVRVASPKTLIRLKEQAIASTEVHAQKHREDIEKLKAYVCNGQA